MYCKSKALQFSSYLRRGYDFLMFPNLIATKCPKLLPVYIRFSSYKPAAIDDLTSLNLSLGLSFGLSLG